MSRLIKLLLTVVAATGATSIAAADIELPKDVDRAVVTLDYRGDRLERVVDSPVMSILADGRVVMPAVYGHSRSYEGRISELELQDLLAFIVKEQRFLEFDEDRVDAKVAGLPASEISPLAVHASTTIIGVDLPLGAQSVGVRGLAKAPRIREYNALRAVEQRLERIMAIVKLGGEKAVAEWLAVANDRLAHDFPHAPPLSMADFATGTRRADDSVHVQFIREPIEGLDGLNLAISANAAGESHIAIVRVEAD